MTYPWTTLDELQEDVCRWTCHNFPKAPPHQPLLGIVEEVGELSHAHLKLEQGIRTDENHVLKAKDAVGDIIIYLLHYCNIHGWNLNEILQDTWASVRKRDWPKHPKTGDPQ